MQASRKIALTWTVLSCLSVASAQQALLPKDEAERNLITAAQRETDPAKKLAILDTWKSAYPESAYQTDRLVMLIQVYQRRSEADRMYATAKELKNIAPTNPNALYYLAALPPGMAVTTPERLAETEQNAADLQAAIPSIFGTPRPNENQSALEAQRRAFERQVLHTNAWVATERKDMPRLESLYRTELQKDPADAESSYALARAILATKQLDRQSEAFYHFARAAYSDGPHALDPKSRQSAQTFVEKNITAYAGTSDAVSELTSQVKSGPFPPRGFYILGAADRHLVEERCTQQRTRSGWARFTNFFSHRSPKLECRRESLSTDFAKVRRPMTIAP